MPVQRGPPRILVPVPVPPSADAPRIFTVIARILRSSRRAVLVRSGSRWRRALVDSVQADANDVVLDVATGTGMVAAEPCAPLSLPCGRSDRSADMLTRGVAPQRSHQRPRHAREPNVPVRGCDVRPRHVHLLLRYCRRPRGDHERAVARPEAGRPPRRSGVRRPLVTGHVRAVALVHTRGHAAWGRDALTQVARGDAFLGPSIEGFYLSIRSVRSSATGARPTRRRAFASHEPGRGIVMHATKRDAPAARSRDSFGLLRAAAGRFGATTGPCCHPPYTAWHLSYVLLGAALFAGAGPAHRPRGGPRVRARRRSPALRSMSSMDGRSRRGSRRAFSSLGHARSRGRGGAGHRAVAMLGPTFGLFVGQAFALVLLYAFEAPWCTSDLGFALAWGAFPVLTARTRPAPRSSPPSQWRPRPP